mgnify:CR=1 FL=1
MATLAKGSPPPPQGAGPAAAQPAAVPTTSSRPRMYTDPSLLVDLVRTPFEAMLLLQLGQLGARIDACFALLDRAGALRSAATAARARVLDDGDALSFVALPLLHDVGRQMARQNNAVARELRACAVDARRLAGSLAIAHEQNSMTAQELAMSGCDELSRQKTALARHERGLIREVRQFLGEAEADGEGGEVPVSAAEDKQRKEGRESQEKMKKPPPSPQQPDRATPAAARGPTFALATSRLPSRQMTATMPSKTPLRSPSFSAEGNSVVPETPCLNMAAISKAEREEDEETSANQGRRSDASSLLSGLSYHSPDMLSSSGKEDLDSSQPLGDASNSQESELDLDAMERAKKRRKPSIHAEAQPSVTM